MRLLSLLSGGCYREVVIVRLGYYREVVIVRLLSRG